MLVEKSKNEMFIKPDYCPFYLNEKFFCEDCDKYLKDKKIVRCLLHLKIIDSRKH